MESKVLSTGVRLSSLPQSYVRPDSERPRLLEVTDCENVPVINLGNADRSQISRQIGDACRSYGFFQENTSVEFGITTQINEFGVVDECIQTRSEVPDATDEHTLQITLASVMQLENTLAIPLEHPIFEPPSNSASEARSTAEHLDDLQTTAMNTAVPAIGVSVAGIFSIGQLLRVNQGSHWGTMILPTTSLLLLCTSFLSGIFLFALSKTRRDFRNLALIIQVLLCSAAISITLGVLMGAVYMVLRGL